MTKWITAGFEVFWCCISGNGGQFLYASAKGVLQRIFQFAGISVTANIWRLFSSNVLDFPI